MSRDCDPAHVTLAILAGGEGSRMGFPKGELRIGAQPILRYLLNAWHWPGPTLLVTSPARQHPPGHDAFAREVCDPIAGGGPLRGLLTVLEHLQTPLLLVLTVDMPAIRPAHCQPLLQNLKSNPQTLGVFYERQLASNATGIEPFPIALRAAARDVIQIRLAAAQRSVHRLLDDPRFASIAPPAIADDRTWTNLNFPGELERYQREGETR